MDLSDEKKPALQILSLEDSYQDFELTRELLIDGGFHPEMERVETEADFIAAVTHKEFDIILADFNLPGFDAFEALKKAREICPEVPFLVVSGAVGEETAIDLIKMGAVDYVMKDRPKRIITAIEHALAGAQQRRARQQMELDLAHKNALLQIAGDAAQIGGWKVDLRTNIAIWSDVVAEIHEMPHGYTPQVEEAINFYTPDWREKITQRFTACVEKGIPFDEEMQILTKNGQMKWVRTIGEPFRDQDGKIILVQGAFQDISVRKQAELELKARESLLSKIFDVLPIGLWVADKDGTLQQGNPAGIKIWGAEPKVPVEEYGVFSARRLPSGEEIAPEDWALERTIRDRVTVKDELLEIDAFDGQKRIVLNYSAPVESEDGELIGAIVVNNDITELHRAEEQLRESEERFRALVDNLPGVVYMCQNNARYTMLFLTESIEAYTGYSRADFLEDRVSILDLYHPADVDEIRRKVEKAVANREPFHLKFRLKAKDADYRWFEEWGIGIYGEDGVRFLEGFIVDVTMQKEVENALIESDRIFNIALKNSPVAVFQQDTDLRYTWIYNPSDVDNVSAEIGKTDMERFSPEDAQKLTELKQRVLDSGRGERQIIETSGNKLPLYVDVTAEPILNDQGNVLGVTCSSVDITEIKLAEQARLKRLAELETLEIITETLRLSRTIDEGLPVLLEKTLQVLKLDAGSIMLYDPSSNTLETHVAAGWLNAIQNYTDNTNVGIAGLVFTSGETHISEDFSKDPLTNPVALGKIPPGWGGAFVPIQEIDHIIGVICVACQLPRQIQPLEIRLLETIARIAGITLHRMKLVEDAFERVEKVQAQQMIDRAIAGIYDFEMMLDIIANQAKNLLSADAVGLMVYEPHNLEFTYAAGSGFQTSGYQASRGLIGKGYLGKAALEQKVVRLVDLNQSDPPFERQELLLGEGFVCYSVAPLVAKGQLKGALEVFHKKKFDHDQDWLRYLESLASQTAIAIENHQNFNQLQRKNLDLTQAYERTIEGWSLALELRDEETEGHSMRVAEMTVRLAKAMGFQEEELVQVRRGALLHDIGKLGVPDSILFKPGELTEDEWEIMKYHARNAYNLLSPIDYLRPALDIPYSHHEKWDGTGYPNQLSGQQIPLSARIFAIVDVWDALSSDRPYRDAWPEEKIFDHLRSQSGIHFDPAVVDKFFELMQKQR